MNVGRPPRWPVGAGWGSAELPRSAVGQLHQLLLGLVIADDDLLGGIPGELATAEVVGNVAEVTRGDGAVTGFGRADAGLPVLIL